MVEQLAPTYPIRIGILFGKLGRLNTTALKYLILHLNTLQSCIEFEILPIDESDRLIEQTSCYREIDSKIVKADLLDFKKRTEEFLRQSMDGYRLKERDMPAGMILLTTAKFTDHFNARSQPNICIIALGHWESHSMAPPSLLEAFVTMTLRQAVSTISPSLRYICIWVLGLVSSILGVGWKTPDLACCTGLFVGTAEPLWKGMATTSWRKKFQKRRTHGNGSAKLMTPQLQLVLLRNWATIYF
jgi:hypothetical protein